MDTQPERRRDLATRNRLHWSWLCLLASLWLPCMADADSNIITIPGQGWHLVLDVPPLTSTRSESNGSLFTYQGEDTVSGLTLRVTTELLPDGDNAKCRQQAWARTREESNVIKGSLDRFENRMLLGATYQSTLDAMGRRFATANASGYFVVNDRCVDVRASVTPYAEKARQTVLAIVQSLRIMK